MFCQPATSGFSDQYILHFAPLPARIIKTKAYTFPYYVECIDLSYSISFYFLKIASHDPLGHKPWNGIQKHVWFHCLESLLQGEQSGSCHPGHTPPDPSMAHHCFSMVDWSFTSQPSLLTAPKPPC